MNRKLSLESSQPTKSLQMRSQHHVVSKSLFITDQMLHDLVSLETILFGWGIARHREFCEARKYAFGSSPKLGFHELDLGRWKSVNYRPFDKISGSENVRWRIFICVLYKLEKTCQRWIYQYSKDKGLSTWNKNLKRQWQWVPGRFRYFQGSRDLRIGVPEPFNIKIHKHLSCYIACYT
jgi:hypothetical protein